jgi:carboxymethylenebutenolidase
MALIEQHVMIPTQFGEAPGFTAVPDEPGHFPAIIFYMDAPGYREELLNHVRRIAKQGYFCVIFDMYYRLGTVRFNLPRRDDGMSGVIRASMNHLTIQRVVEDTGAVLAYIDAQDKASPGKVGAVGHCMSGQHVTAAAARYPTRIACGASLYSVKMVTDAEDSPHKLLNDTAGELFYSFAEVDQSVPEEEYEAFVKALKASSANYILERPKGTHHGYMFAQRAVYNPVESEGAWDKIFALFDRNLK